MIEDLYKENITDIAFKMRLYW